MTFSPIRAVVILALVGGAYAALMGRVAWLQTWGRQTTIKKADAQQFNTETLPARRGTVFDRNGQAIAVTVEAHAVFVDPKLFLEYFTKDGRTTVDQDNAVEDIARLLGTNGFELGQKIGRKPAARYLRIADRVDDNVAAALMKKKIGGLGVEPVSMRSYPMGPTAAHIIGGVGSDGTGLEGVELKYQKLLAGRDGTKRTQVDARQRGISVAEGDHVLPEHGQSLVLTIDSAIQMIVEQELAATVTEYGAARGSAVVMDPQTGEILALANYPAYSPAALSEVPPELRRNAALVMPYEPGSTFKLFLMGPALAGGVTKPEEIWPIDGKTWVGAGGRRVTDVHYYGKLASWDGITKSSNIVMSMLCERMGPKRLDEALKGFGFGSDTGIDLPGEGPGRIPKDYRGGGVISVAQGYAVLITPVQLARGFCVYANGGRLVSPHVLRGVLKSDGSVASHEPDGLRLNRRVMDTDSANLMRRILADAVARGTGRAFGRSEVWNIFGKTGTAHIAVRGKYDDANYTASFVGGAPFENPRIVVAYVITKPQKSIAHFGGMVAAPGALRVMERTLAYLKVPASPELTPPPPHIAAVLNNYSPDVYKRKPEPRSRVAASND